MIESLSNEKIKRVLRCQQKRGRKQLGQFTVEGAREIHRALQSGWNLDFLLVQPDLAEASQEAAEAIALVPGTKVWPVSDTIFQKCAVRENTDGLLAVFQEKTWTLADLQQPNKEPLFLIALDGVEKPGNLGAVLRTADGAGAHGVILLGSSVDPWNPNVIRASLGTVFSVPVFALSDDEFAAFLKERRCELVTLSPEASHQYYAAPLTEKPIVALFGSEAFGVRELWKKQSQKLVRIPMLGIADSLNLSVAVALLTYERLRQLSSN
ncbi:MAG: TrmH family RNA methyltransferase [Oligoflexus sp.]